MPVLGVKGAAVGTLIARMVEFIIILVYMLKFEKKINYKIHMLKFKDKNLLKDIIKYGMPVICNELLWGIGISIHAVILGHLSSSVVAANSICNVIYQMSTSFILGITVFILPVSPSGWVLYFKLSLPTVSVLSRNSLFSESFSV